MAEKNRCAFSAPLNELDTEVQPYGCIGNNANICVNNYIIIVYTVTLKDCICHRHSGAWKKQYYKLKEGGVNG